MGEAADTDHKRSLDLDRPVDRLLLVRDIAAMANTGGGTILIGVDTDGAPSGLDATLAGKLEPEAIMSLVDHHISPDHLDLAIERRPTSNGLVIELGVPAAETPPLVLTRPGAVGDGASDDTGLGDEVELEADDDGHEVRGPAADRTVFGAHSVWVRRGNRSRPARREDHRRWRHDAIAAVKRDLLARLTMVVEAEDGARVQIVARDDVRDEPGYLLRRSTDLFRQRPERLLSPDDLSYLWLHRAAIDLDDEDAQALVLQSALRRRTTLFLWLAELELPPDEIRRQLRKAVTMNDRDKSDAARSILQLAALHLGDLEYARFCTALASSGYAHMRRAASEWPDPSDARASLDAMANARLARLTDSELVAEAETIIREQPSRATRALPGIGFALLGRRRTRRGHSERPELTRRR